MIQTLNLGLNSVNFFLNVKYTSYLTLVYLLSKLLQLVTAHVLINFEMVFIILVGVFDHNAVLWLVHCEK